MVVGIVTCKVKPEPDPDEAPLLEALAARGVRAEIVAWDDADVAWRGLDACALRSTWNYVHHLPAFLAWLARAETETRVLNPPEIVRWNLRKTYLRELAERGIPTPPTAWIGRGEGPDLVALAAARGWTDVVVKPVVGAASFATRRFAGSDLAEGAAYLAEHAQTREMMVQPYLASVEGYGERSIIWLDGEFTHAVRKNPRFGGAYEQVSDETGIAEDELRLARAHPRAALARFPLMRGWTDLARDASGVPLLMELELAEPSLFLVQSPRALARFADAIAHLRPA